MAARPAHCGGHRLRRANDQAALAVERLDRIHPLRSLDAQAVEDRGQRRGNRASLFLTYPAARPVEKLQVLFQRQRQKIVS